MMKLIICLTATVVTAICLTQLRQQRLEIGHDASRLHRLIEARQGTLWTQQVRIAGRTTPGAVRAAIGVASLKVEAVRPAGVLASVWADDDAGGSADVPDRSRR